MRSLSWRAVWQQRLAAHHLLSPAPRDQLVQVVAEVCGIHAQVAASAELSLGLRIRGLHRQDVHAALWRERSLVKTYGLRGTLHLFPTHELGLWLAALRSLPSPRPARSQEPHRLSPERIEQLVEAMREVLDGRQLTRDELGEALAARLGAWVAEPFGAFGGAIPRWHLALGPAALAGVLAFGPNRGNRVSYVRLDQWVGPLPEVDGQHALREVCRRYLAAYGPTTRTELARWLATTPAAAGDVLRSLADEVEEVDVESWPALALRGAPAVRSPADHGCRGASEQPASAHRMPASVHLLPHFDCYVVGCHPRAQLIPAAAPAALQHGTAAQFPVLLVDGVVAGLWQRRRHSTRQPVELRIDPFVPLSPRHQQALATQAQRISAFLEVPVELTQAPVEPRPHL